MIPHTKISNIFTKIRSGITIPIYPCKNRCLIIYFILNRLNWKRRVTYVASRNVIIRRTGCRLIGFFIVIYYAVIMAWSFSYLYDSFSITEWAQRSKEHFYATVGVDKVEGPFDWGNFRWPLLVGLCLTWGAIVASVWRGATTTATAGWTYS